MKGVAKDHICVTHRHRQQCGDGQREGVGWVEVVGKGSKTGTSVIVSTIQVFLKEKHNVP